MGANDCEISIEFDSKEIIKSIANICNIEFLTEKSKPDSAEKVFTCLHHVLKCVARQIERCSIDGKHLALFANELGFDKYINREKEIDDILKNKEMMTDEIREAFKKILSGVTKN